MLEYCVNYLSKFLLGNIVLIFKKYILSLVVYLCEVNSDLEMKLNGLQAFGPGIMFAYCSNYGDEWFCESFVDLTN